MRLLVDDAASEQTLIDHDLTEAVARGDRDEVFKLACVLIGKTAKPNNSPPNAGMKSLPSPSSPEGHRLSLAKRDLQRKTRKDAATPDK